MKLNDLKKIIHRDRSITHKALKRKKKSKLEPNLNEPGIKGIRMIEPPNGGADGTPTY